MFSKTYLNKVPFYKFIIHASAIAKNPIPFHNTWFNQKGDIFIIKPPFIKPIILTREASFAKSILQKHHKKYHKSKIQSEFLAKYIGLGLLTANGSYWLKQRRLIQPGFHKKKMDALMTSMHQLIKEQVEQFTLDVMKPLYPLMNILAFKVVATSLFSYAVDRKTLERLQYIIQELQTIVVNETRKPLLRQWNIISGRAKGYQELVAESRQIIKLLIEQRKLTSNKPDDLLQMLLEATYEDGTKMTMIQLIDEILILFVAGHETTANALTFTLTLLAKHKAALKKVKNEVAKASKKETTVEALRDLKYTKHCIEESLRLYPPAWITDRVAIEDDTINKIPIKKETMIGISIFELHRNPKYWYKAEEFIPERFERNTNLSKANFYLPFGSGPRLCIGNNFAMIQMLLTVYEVIKNYKIRTNTKHIKYNPLITLKPVNCNLKFNTVLKKHIS